MCMAFEISFQDLHTKMGVADMRNRIKYTGKKDWDLSLMMDWETNNSKITLGWDHIGKFNL